MVKGVNKQIVEINYTKDEYVEKAILIINPEKSKLPPAVINQKAMQYMQGVLKDGLPPRAKPLPAAEGKNTAMLSPGAAGTKGALDTQSPGRTVLPVEAALSDEKEHWHFSPYLLIGLLGTLFVGAVVAALMMIW